MSPIDSASDVASPVAIHQPRVLIICPDMPPLACGIADYLSATLLQAARHEIDITVLHAQEDALPISGVRLIFLKEVSGRRFVEGVRQAIAEVRPDILHIQYQPAMYGGKATIFRLPQLLRRSGFRGPVVTTFHDFTLPYLFPKAKPIRPYFVRHLVKHSDWYVITNALDRRTGEDRFEARPERMISIPIGSNFTSPGIEPPPHEGFRAGYFGLVMKEKGLDIALKAVALASRDLADLSFRIIGSHRSETYTDELRSLANDLGIADRIHFTGHVPPEQAALELSSLDACILLFDEGVSTRRTSFPSAMACGVPTITTSADPMPEGLEGGLNCIAVSRPAAAADVASALLRLASNPQLRESMAEAAKQWAEGLDYRHIGARHAEMYRCLCATGSAAP